MMTKPIKASELENRYAIMMRAADAAYDVAIAAGASEAEAMDTWRAAEKAAFAAKSAMHADATIIDDMRAERDGLAQSRHQNALNDD